jgi:hypothetical protein
VKIVQEWRKRPDSSNPVGESYDEPVTTSAR